jgi:hypothetical protein
MADTCRACGASIQWAVTPAGKKMPLDMKKKTVCELVDGPEGHEIARMVSGYESHFGTCPKADEMRGTKR